MIIGHDPSLRADEASPRAGCAPLPANTLAALLALNMITSGAYWMVLGLGAVVFWALPRAWRFGFLALLSFGYLASVAPLSVCALSAWAALFYTAALSPAVRRRFGGWLWLVIGLLGFLAWFKYAPPLLAAIAPSAATADFVIPLGISYITFKLIHYAIEASRGNITDRSWQQFFCYVLLLPIFTAGPIERFDHFLAHQDDRPHVHAVVEGLTRIIHGLVKKFLIADLVLVSLTRGLTPAGVLANLDRLPARTVWLVMIVSFLYLYLDFSAYSDIAIGASRLFGLRIAENFNLPILASDIGEFWRRWHMTLAAWCQSYVYLPTIGLTRSPYLATYATMLAVGLWHAGSLGWICWGLYHASGLSVFVAWSRLARRRKWRFREHPLWRLAGVPVTFAFVVAGAAFPAFANAGGPVASVRVLAKMFFVSRLAGLP